MNQKGLAVPVVIIAILIVAVFTFLFLARPFKTPENAVKPFKGGELILAERVSYLFKDPDIGDRTLFIPKDRGIEYVGIITKIEEDNQVKTYTVVSTGTGQPWIITEDKIVWRIYYPQLSKEERNTILSSFPQPSPTNQPSNNIPSENYPANFTLASAWEKLSTYTNPNLGVTFQYPTTFITTVNSLNYNSSALIKPSFSVTIRSPFASSEETNKLGFDWTSYSLNTMRVTINQYDTDKLSLYDFISQLNKTYPGNGITETFETFKKSLKPVTLPKEGSYEFDGILGENPTKELYFENNGKVYLFVLSGGTGTGEGYSKEAENSFNSLVKSIVFK